ncbi:ARM repeat-containing protein [Xylona heveae TC161]|uniref:ARM repeat-containing protein n=1 Tax=Xylona heveae (strain CBS 132557 / TC161) TaxID=1328760 RepID=A0A165HKB3_XYLHT|nr:ARM repeat-containing protein [Xylona heveae TC161]KZF23640.1 ARM repeat-containing protein [Xylona heveae TC161]
MAWQPQEEQLVQLAGFLRDSLNVQNQTVFKHAASMLAQAKESPDINNYLTYLVAQTDVPAALKITIKEAQLIKSTAAIMLKNNVRFSYDQIAEPSRAYIRSCILLALEDPNAQIRSLSGNVVTELVRQGGILGWPQLLPQLMALVSNDSGSTSLETQEGAMSALYKICEDNARALDKDYQGERPLNFLIPKLLEFTTHASARVRGQALSCINIFIPHKPQALLVVIDAFLLQLFQLAHDTSAEVRRNVCRAFVLLVDVRPDKLKPHMDGLIEYTVSQQRIIEDSDLALDAAEFWLCVGEHEALAADLGRHLALIVPVLLECMVYSEDDIIRLGGEGDDAEEEDREEDIKPQFAKTKLARNAPTKADGSGADASGDALDEDDLSEGEIDDDDDDDDDGGDPEDQWNLRKCSAAALDVLASVFHRPVFEITLPYLKENLQHAEWPRREAAVLALGAVAEGCMSAVKPHLPDLVPYLISLLNDQEPVVRQITCWTLGRYSAWASHLKDPAEKAQFFEPMMVGLLHKMLDNNKRVQEAGASAFASLEEKAKSQLTPYCQPIIQQFIRCFGKYKDRNMFILYDCVQTLAEHIGPGLAAPGLVDLLMPALIDRWNRVTDQSRELFPLLECLSYVAIALGKAFAPFSGPIFTRCIKVVHTTLEEYVMAAGNGHEGVDLPDKDFLITSLDLLSSIIQALDDADGLELVKTSKPNLFQLLAYALDDPANEVRQSGYALLGDCAIYVFPELEPFLATILPILSGQLDLDKISFDEVDASFAVLNNACWSCGEVATKYGPEGMGPFLDILYERLVTIMTNPELPDSLVENAAIAIGRLGILSAPALAPHVAELVGPFLEQMEKVEFTDEKADAFRGFTRIVALNAAAIEQHLIKYFTVIARYPAVHQQDGVLFDHFKAILDLYRSMIPDFDTFVGSNMAPSDRQILQNLYGV